MGQAKQMPTTFLFQTQGDSEIDLLLWWVMRAGLPPVLPQICHKLFPMTVAREFIESRDTRRFRALVSRYARSRNDRTNRAFTISTRIK